jgi:hypothetical protein
MNIEEIYNSRIAHPYVAFGSCLTIQVWVKIERNEFTTPSTFLSLCLVGLSPCISLKFGPINDKTISLEKTPSDDSSTSLTSNLIPNQWNYVSFIASVKSDILTITLYLNKILEVADEKKIPFTGDVQDSVLILGNKTLFEKCQE